MCKGKWTDVDKKRKESKENAAIYTAQHQGR